MPLPRGASAPAFTLPGADGVRIALDELHRATPAVVLAFVKTACPTCAITVPVLGRLARHLGDAVPVIAVAEDALATAAAWASPHGITNVASDAYNRHRAARAFNVRTLPTVVLCAGGMVELAFEGWSRVWMNDLVARASELARLPPLVASTPDDGLPPVKAGCWARSR